MMISPIRNARDKALTLLELLIVIAIIGTLMALLIPGMGKVLDLTRAAKNTVNLREIGIATINWASDNGNKLPSPEYPGGMEVPSGVKEEDFFPEHYKLGHGSGLWLDGVVFGAVYMKEDKDGMVTTYQVDEDGEHLKGTLFENTQSVKKDPTEKNWHKHSYAMNANLQYDRIYDEVDSSDPWLTEKTLSNLVFAPNAMLYIECDEENVIMRQDRELILDTAENRWDGGKVIAFFLDGHAERIAESQIPDGDENTDRETSRFWRGVDAD